MEKFYRQKIMQHYTLPCNKGLLELADRRFVGKNHVCGDRLEVTLALDSAGKVTAVGWEGVGCAISQASASIFSEMMVGKSIQEVVEFESDDFLKHLNIPLSPTRRKCATLMVHTLKHGQV